MNVNRRARFPVLMYTVCIVSIARSAVSVHGGIDRAHAARYFAEARAVCARDGGKLWGVSLYGPMMFVDPPSREIVANQADPKGRLSEADGVFVGTLPAALNVANTAVDWAGTRWTMLVWPLPEDQTTRARLMTHELWHRVQDSLGFPASNPSNAHLDSRDGRYWLQLEWRALTAALGASGDARRAAIADALLFRSYRRSLFDNASSEERALEMNEGLAEYTGVALSEPDAAASAIRAVEGLREYARRASTFVRAFAYGTGPAYGVLLDAIKPDWRLGLSADDDLGELLARALAAKPHAANEATAKARAKVYDDGSLRGAEDAREEARKARQATYRKRFVEGPVLTLPLRKINVQFDPGTLEPLDEIGTVYPTIRVSDEWGVIEVSDGALLSTDWTWLRVEVEPPFDPARLDRKGWTLTLNDRWKVVPDSREGCYTLRRE